MVSIDRKTKNGSLPAAAQEALAREGGDASFLLYVDFRSFMSWAAGLAPTMGPGMGIPAIADGPAVPLVLTASSEGRNHVMNLRVDVVGIAGMFPKPPR